MAKRKSVVMNDRPLGESCAECGLIFGQHRDDCSKKSPAQRGSIQKAVRSRKKRTTLEKLQAIDAKKRAAQPKGWSGSFLAPEVPPARTPLEKRAVEIMAACEIDVRSNVTVHIYNVVAAVQMALETKEKVADAPD